MKEIKPYKIYFAKNENLVKAMNFLFSKGLVFTSSRIRSWSQLNDVYDDNTHWKWLFICHDDVCKRVMNTTSRTYYRQYDAEQISYKEFVKEILPQI